ncbi:hypothetical protein HER10_EVM0001500 [Colletotrichum scovillei]|uniref:uncharacterized protein n=1 Tax=Colletotrichum scovillei TaxID=1209932 RepID=UPI0015C323FE|nr:uncharacterized protein HER10_EVM0001500 [Colletotrichum scovillei]KAF4783900.1 hypothetical protein HER10_EVM0001500 [Colletotrichum scovillei]
MANPQPPFTGAGAGANILTPNSNASNLKPITKIRLCPPSPCSPRPRGTTTPRPGTKPKAIKLAQGLVVLVASLRRQSPPETPPPGKQSTVSETPTPESPATAPVRTYPSRFATLYATAARVDHWLNQQVALHAARVSPFSAFSAAAAAAAANANANPKKRPRVLISTRNLAWMRASNGVWVKVPLAGWKEKQMRPVT